MDDRCRTCGGSGKVTETRNTYYDYEETCRTCGGSGRADVVVLDRAEYEKLKCKADDVKS